VDIALGILVAQEQHLGNDEIRQLIIDAPAQKDNPIAQQTRIDIVRALTAPRLLNHDGNILAVSHIH
jgi:hypothetical protein